MKTNELVSVIVPVYNVEKYLKKCVESIINQTYKQLEIILVDDGSTDQSGILCDKFAAKDKRIKVIHKENGGLSDARNRGLDVCRGKYICFIDSDDYIHKDMIKLLYSEMNKGVELAICNFCRVNENGDILDKLYEFQDEIIDQEQFWNKYYFKNSAYCGVAWNKMYRKEIFNKIRYDKGKIHEDERILHKVIRQCKRISCISFIGYYYVSRKGSIGSNISVCRCCDAVEGYLERAKWFRDNNMFIWENMALRSGMYNFALMGKDKKQESSKVKIDFYYKKYKKYILKYKVYKHQKIKEKIKLRIFLLNYNIYTQLYNFYR